jgi:hypothetical protein
MKVPVVGTDENCLFNDAPSLNMTINRITEPGIISTYPTIFATTEYEELNF